MGVPSLVRRRTTGQAPEAPGPGSVWYACSFRCSACGHEWGAHATLPTTERCPGCGLSAQRPVEFNTYDGPEDQAAHEPQPERDGCLPPCRRPHRKTVRRLDLD